MKTPEQQIEAIRRNLKLDLDAIKMRADLALSVVAQLEAPPQPARKAREFIVTDETDNSGYSIRGMTENEKWFFKKHHLLSACNRFVVREVLEENEK